MDGWTFNPGFNSQPYTYRFSDTMGVTNGKYSLEIDGTTDAQSAAGLDYGVLLASPNSLALTNYSSNSLHLSIDVLKPAGSFGFGLRIDLDLNDGGSLGFQSLDGFGYPSPTPGVETTMIFPISVTQRNELAADYAAGFSTQIFIQAGSGETLGNQSFWLDNVQANFPPLPEPGSISVLGVFAVGMLGRRRGR